MLKRVMEMILIVIFFPLYSIAYILFHILRVPGREDMTSPLEILDDYLEG